MSERSIRHGEDHCFRMGGEEFAVIFTEPQKSSSIVFAKRIKDEIEGLQIPHKNNTAAPVITVSLGLFCTNNLLDKDELEHIYSYADALLYKAKESGRNTLIYE